MNPIVLTVLLSLHSIAAASRDTIPREGFQQIQFDASRFDSVTAFALRNLLDNAASRGLPTGPLVSRALEGAARRASSDHILKVVRDHAAALAEARDALGVESRVNELDAGAMAIRSGIPRTALRAIRASRPSGSVEMPLTVLTDIVLRGVPNPTAQDAVTSISQMPGSDEALQGLQITVAKNAIRGPGMAVDALNRYLRGTVQGFASPSTPATGDRKPIRPPAP